MCIDSASLFHFPQLCRIGDCIDLLTFLMQLPVDFYEVTDTTRE